MGKSVSEEFIMAKNSITEGLINDTSSLCFRKDVFMNEDFSVDRFVSENRKNASLETLREDLSIYLRVLRCAMIELINQDYADFVNLSSNLAGLDKSINNLCVPLGQLKEEVLAVRSTFIDALTVAQQQIKKKQDIRDKKMVLQRVIAVTEGVNRLEELCHKSIFLSEDQIKMQSANANMYQEPGDIVERIASELSQVDIYLKKTSTSSLLRPVSQKLEKIRQVLHRHLEQSFLSSLESPSGKDLLHAVLRASASIGHIPVLQELFLRKIVRPRMMKIISERNLHQKGLVHIYKEIFEFINHKCHHLLDTKFSIDSSCDTQLAFVFLSDVVWPEIVSCLESRVPSIFSPGNPVSFQKNYLASQAFLQQLYSVCPTERILHHLKDTTAHATFLSKWNLPVYYQIRFQEIAGALETSFMTPYTEPKGVSLFCLNCSQTLVQSMAQCWSREVHLDYLSHRFWKLTLQLLTRFINWVQQIIKAAQEGNQVESKPASQDVLNNGLADGTATPSEPESTVKHLVMLVTDLQKLQSQVPSFFDDTVQPVIVTQGFRNVQSLRGNLMECATELSVLPDKVSDLLVARLVVLCSAHLRMAVDIPRLYRKTNKEVPTKASTYVSLIFQPLEAFEESHGTQIPSNLWNQWRMNIAEKVTENYLSVTRDVLHSVKKMEDSLKRLKKVRERTPVSGGTTNASGTITDDDKIRIQFAIDVQNFGLKMDTLNVESSSLTSYPQLVELVESTRNTPSS